MYLTDIIGKSYTNWKSGSKVFIDAQTGMGKTTFILNKLLPYAIEHGVEILYVCNRDLLRRQIVYEMCKLHSEVPYELMIGKKVAEFNGITVITYQKMQEWLDERESNKRLSGFYYVVTDEIHYIEEDSDFNPEIQRCVKWLNSSDYKVLIAISATLGNVAKHLGFDKKCNFRASNDIVTLYEKNSDLMKRLSYGNNEMFWMYRIPRKFPQYNVLVYAKTDELVNTINNDCTDEKWLVFQSNKEKAYTDIKKKLRHESVMITATEKNSSAVEEIVETNSFNKRILITTKAIDNGVSFHDSKLRNIVIETTSDTEFLQMLGRKRLSKEDAQPINLYLPQYSAKYFRSLLLHQVDPALAVMEMKSDELKKAILKSKDVYDRAIKFFDVQNGKFIRNEIAYERFKNRKTYFQQLIKEMEQDELYFVKERLSWLGIKSLSNVTFLQEVEREKATERFMNIVEEVAGTELKQDEQKKFREQITKELQVIFPERFQHKNRTMGLKQINNLLKELGGKCQVKSINGKKKGESTIWIIEKHLLEGQVRL